MTSYVVIMGYESANSGLGNDCVYVGNYIGNLNANTPSEAISKLKEYLFTTFGINHVDDLDWDSKVNDNGDIVIVLTDEELEISYYMFEVKCIG